MGAEAIQEMLARRIDLDQLTYDLRNAGCYTKLLSSVKPKP